MSTDHPPSVLLGPAPAEAAPHLTGPKRQHYLPRFYLHGFTGGSGSLAVYDRETNVTRSQQPANTAVVGHLYTGVDQEGRKRFEFEQFLSKIEGLAAPIIPKLVDGEELSEDERVDLAYFVAFSACRTPAMLDRVKDFNSQMVRRVAKGLFLDVAGVKEILRSKHGAAISEDELEEEARKASEFIMSDRYKVTTNHRWAVGVSAMVASDIADIFVNRDWIVIHRSDDRRSFITTDYPVILEATEPRERLFRGVGYANMDALVLMPLHQSCMLALRGTRGRLEHRTATPEQVRGMNLRIASSCQRFVIGRDEALVRSLADHLRLDQSRWLSGVHVA